MGNVKLDTLSNELIAHIACYGDASSVFRLSLTSRSVRSACNDGLVFKNILAHNQLSRWNQRCLDLEAIALRAQNDAVTWARYALADEKAWELSQKEYPLEAPRNFINYLPELLVTKHPFVNDRCWKQFFYTPYDQKLSQVFCLAMAILASDDATLQGFRRLQVEDSPFLRQDDTPKGSLWALCNMAITIRSALKMRLEIWPYNTAAIVPHVNPPKAMDIPLRPIDDTYSLPVPFSRQGIELLGRATSSFSSWNSWYDLHTYACFRSPSYFTEGIWCGYYLHFGTTAASFESPMSEIRFQYGPYPQTEHSPSGEVESTTLRALDCIDGRGRFDINGTISYSDRMVKFHGRKQYARRGWQWDCRLTPFGIVGYYGSVRVPGNPMSGRGLIWLWKTAWTSEG